MIIIVSGLPGSGKSYFASALAKRIAATYLNSDRIRNAVGARGKYSTDDKMRIYEIMAAETRENILAGKPVVVDGTFYRNAMIDLFREQSAALATPLLIMSVIADENLIKERLSRPREESEADFKVYLTVKDQIEPMHVPYLTLQSRNDNLEEMLAIAMDYIKKSDE